MSQTLDSLLTREKEKNEELKGAIEEAGKKVYAAMDSDSTPYSAYIFLEEAFDILARQMPRLRKLGTRQKFHNLPSMVGKLTGKE